MSIELLPTLEKETNVKQKGGSTSSETSKKEGMSLFDSLLNDAKKDSSTVDTKQGKTPSQNSTKQRENLPQNSTKQEKNLSPNSTNQPNKQAVTPIKKATEVNNIVVDKQETKQLADELVEIVVEKAKSVKDKSKLLENESKVKEKVVELKESIKQSVKEKTQEIKESVKEIKKVVKNLKEETPKHKESKETAKELKAENKQEVKQVVSEVTSTIKQTVKEKTQEIKESASEIKKSVSKFVEKTDKKTEQAKSTIDKNVAVIQSKVDKKTDEITEAVEDIDKNIAKLSLGESSEPKTKNSVQDDSTLKESVPKNKKIIVEVEDESFEQKSIKIHIEQKTQQITQAVDEIEQTVSKVSFVSTDEIVKSIQELKKELQSPKIPVVSPQAKENHSSEVNDKSSVIANGLLHEQQNVKIQTSLRQVTDAKKNIEEKKNLGSVKESAKMLDLNPDEISVENVGEQGESKAELFAKNNKEFNQSFFNQKSLNKAIIENEMQAKDIEIKEQEKSIHKTTDLDGGKQAAQKEANVTLNVPQNIVESIQSKIIGAQQKMGSFMSDVARNMYLNYKPPFTSFKMSLNPANLGSISIVMRASKSDNSITVSMNMNNTNTMDAFVENKSTLQNAIQKQLGDGSNVSLSFGMDNGNDNSDFNNFFGNESSQNSSENNSEIAAAQTEELQEETNDTTNYM